jgi:hypothetical protein
MRWALMCAWYRATILWLQRAPPSKLASFISLRQIRNMFAWHLHFLLLKFVYLF